MRNEKLLFLYRLNEVNIDWVTKTLNKQPSFIFRVLNLMIAQAHTHTYM